MESDVEPPEAVWVCASVEKLTDPPEPPPAPETTRKPASVCVVICVQPVGAADWKKTIFVPEGNGSMFVKLAPFSAGKLPDNLVASIVPPVVILPAVFTVTSSWFVMPRFVLAVAALARSDKLLALAAAAFATSDTDLMVVSMVSRSVLIFVPQVFDEAPGSGFVSE